VPMWALLFTALVSGLPASPLAKDQALFAPPAAPAEEPQAETPEEHASAVAVARARDLADDLKQYQMAVVKKKAAAEMAKKQATEGAAATPAAKTAPPAQPAAAEKKTFTASPPPMLSKAKLARLEKAAAMFNHAAHALTPDLPVERPAPRVAPRPQTAKEQEAERKSEESKELAQHENTLKEQREKTVAAFHDKLQGSLKEMRTAAADAAAESHRTKHAGAPKRVAKPKPAAPRAQKPVHKRDARADMMKVVEAGWAREASSH